MPLSRTSVPPDLAPFTSYDGEANMTAQTTRQLAPMDTVSRAVKLKAALVKAFSAIGFKNGHSAPDGHENLHLLYVFNEARKYFDKLYENQLDSILTSYELENDCELCPVGESLSLVDEDFYTLVLRRTTPSKRVDNSKFATELRKRGVAQNVIDLAREAATVETRPPRRFEVIVK